MKSKKAGGGSIKDWMNGSLLFHLEATLDTLPEGTGSQHIVLP